MKVEKFLIKETYIYIRLKTYIMNRAYNTIEQPIIAYIMIFAKILIKITKTTNVEELGLPVTRINCSGRKLRS